MAPFNFELLIVGPCVGAVPFEVIWPSGEAEPMVIDPSRTIPLDVQTNRVAIDNQIRLADGQGRSNYSFRRHHSQDQLKRAWLSKSLNGR